jgi:molybdenum cofactor synthesis domain-containing protein
MSFRALVVTASNRAADGIYEDRSGPVLVEGLVKLGLEVDGPQVVHDGEEVYEALKSAVSSKYQLVVTSGGTGISPTDLTPEMTSRLLDAEVPGIAEAMRADGVSRGLNTAVLSRGRAGLAGRTLIINVAGSPGAARDALTLFDGFLIHALGQISGEDHS